jgi:hypothetical protein
MGDLRICMPSAFVRGKEVLRVTPIWSLDMALEDWESITGFGCFAIQSYCEDSMGTRSCRRLPPSILVHGKEAFEIVTPT